MPELTASSCMKLTVQIRSALVFDWGKRHIGVALVARTTGVPIPLKTLHAERGNVDHTQLDQLVADYAPDVFVVGLPRNMDGTKSPETKHAQRLGQHLSKRYDRTVTYVDERLTTREAVARVNKPHPDHSIAALIIAEAWLAGQS